MSGASILRLLFLLAGLQSVGIALSEDEIIKSPSPDGRYALRLVKSPEGEVTAAIIDAKSHAAVVWNLPYVTISHMDSAQLVWSADSKRVAFGIIMCVLCPWMFIFGMVQNSSL